MRNKLHINSKNSNTHLRILDSKLCNVFITSILNCLPKFAIASAKYKYITKCLLDITITSEYSVNNSQTEKSDHINPTLGQRHHTQYLNVLTILLLIPKILNNF